MGWKQLGGWGTQWGARRDEKCFQAEKWARRDIPGGTRAREPPPVTGKNLPGSEPLLATMHVYELCWDDILCPLLIILLCHLCISVSFEPLYGPPPRGAQAPSQLWPKVEARVRGPCARNAPSSWQVCRPPASSLSVGVCSAISICGAWGGQTWPCPRKLGRIYANGSGSEGWFLQASHPSYQGTVKPHLLFSSGFLLIQRTYPEGFLTMDQICFFEIHRSKEEVIVYLQLSHWKSLKEGQETWLGANNLLEAPIVCANNVTPNQSRIAKY